MLSFRHYIAAGLCLFAALASPPAAAQFTAAIAVFGGTIAIDRAGKELRDSVDHAEAAANALLGRADDIAKRRLEQIDGILKYTVAGLVDKSEAAALAILGQAVKDVNALEKEILADVRKAIWDVECTGRRLAISDLKTALGGLGEFLGTGQIKLTPAQRILPTPRWFSGCLWSCKDPYVVDVTEPFGETYRRVRDLMEGAIVASAVIDSTPAHNIVGTYEFLSNFALMASCFYPGSEERYNREHIKYRELARQWNNIVEVKL